MTDIQVPGFLDGTPTWCSVVTCKNTMLKTIVHDKNNVILQNHGTL